MVLTELAGAFTDKVVDIHVLSLRAGRRSGCSGAPWRRSSTQCRWSRCSTALSRRWRNSRWTCSLLMISRFPSRVQKCPKSSSRTSRRDARVANRSRRNSWRKCRRFWFLVVKVNKVFCQCRVRPLLRSWSFWRSSRFLPRPGSLVSRSLTLQFVVVEFSEVFKVPPKTRFVEADCGADR